MNEFDFRTVESFPEPGFGDLTRETFNDFAAQSQQLADVLAAEAAHRDGKLEPSASPSLRIAVFLGEQLVGWTYAVAEAGNVLHMVNSGVAPAQHGRGVYSQLVQRTVEYATSHGFKSIRSRHVPTSNAVIIPKLKAGFQVSGFEYSEVYGPLVCLSYLVSEERRALHRARSMPITPR